MTKPISKVPNKDLVLKELASRAGAVRFRLEDYLFKEQLAFVNDPAPFATAVCSVRAGKTTACAGDLTRTALNMAGVVCLYITLSRSNAKKIVWPELKRLNREYKLGGKVNESELAIYYPNGSIIYASGASDKTEIEKFRGLALALCYIDECQAFRSYIQELVDEVIAKRLFDYNGRLRLIGTPGPVPAGYFYECALSDQWSHHYWTMFNNPWLVTKSGVTHQALLDRELKRKGVLSTDPSIQRECFGRWIVDGDSLVVRYDASKNHYDNIPTITNHVIGVDLGHDDADAIAVIGWDDDSPVCYLVEEFTKKGQTVTELADRITHYVTKYEPMKVVVDTGGLGKKIAEELRKRFSLPVEAAEKSRKYEYIELMNDALRSSRLMAKKNSLFAQDSSLLEWDKDAKLDKPKVKDTFHSDIIDAVLYAYREAMHWLYKEKELKEEIGSKKYWAEQVANMEEAARNAMENKQGDDELGGFEPFDPFAKWPT